MARHLDEPADVQVKGRSHVLGAASESGATSDAGVVDEDVEAPVTAPHLIDRRGRVAEPRHVGDDPRDPGVLCGRFTKLMFLATGHHNLGAGLGVRERHRAADTRASTALSIRQQEAGHRITARPNVDALGDRNEADPCRLKLTDVPEEVKRTAPKAVELPHEYRIDLTTLRRVKYANQPGPLVVRAAARLAHVKRHPQARTAAARQTPAAAAG